MKKLVFGITSVFALLAGAADVSFSFKYGGETFDAARCGFAGAASGKAFQVADGVRVTLEKKAWPEADAVEWLLWFENTGEKDSAVFSEINDCDLLHDFGKLEHKRPGYSPKPGDIRIRTMKGMVPGIYYSNDDRVSAQEYEFRDIYLRWNESATVKNASGRSSDEMMPFFDVNHASGGLMTAVGWTGGWRADFALKGNALQIRSGLASARFYLRKGEKVRTSSTLVMSYAAGEDPNNKFRRLIRDHYSHTANTRCTRTGILACELWGGLPSKEMLKRIGELKRYGIRFDDLWLDAGWYGDCTKCDDPYTGDWGRKTGDWNVNRRVHPGGLEDVAAAAKDAGMGMMLWFEPERSANESAFYKAHKEWHLEDILYLGNKETRDYLFSLLDGYITRLGMSCYRQDFNTSLPRVWQKHDEKDRAGILEIKHITGMYEVWDRLLAKHPNLLIDNCSSGGRRIDIETLKRSIPFFRSDYQCAFNAEPEVTQAHNMISSWLPYNGCTTKTKSDTYAARSTFSSSWGGAFYNAIFQSMDDADFRWAKQITDEYRLIRGYLAEDFHNHGSRTLDETAWAIWQYNDPKAQKGVVLAFRRKSSPYDSATIELKGIADGKTPKVRSLDGYPLEIAGNRLIIHLKDKRSSTVVLYE